MSLLAAGHDLTVAELNAAAVSNGLADAKGAIVGGINALSRRYGRSYPLTSRDADGKKPYSMKAGLRAMFREVLRAYPEAGLFQDLEEGRTS